MEKVELNKTARSILVNVLIINALVWVIGHIINEFQSISTYLNEIEKIQYSQRLIVLTLSGIVFVIQSILLFIKRGHHFVFPVLGILFASIYYIIGLVAIFMSDVSLSLDVFIIFGELTLFVLLQLRTVQLIINRF